MSEKKQNKIENSEKKIFTVEISDSDKRKRLVANTLRMISRRVYFQDGAKYGLVDYDKHEHLIDENNDVYEFKCRNGTKIFLKLLLQKVTSINKIAGVTDFLADYKDHHKIFIFKEVPKKTHAQIVGMGKTEVFQEPELLIDVLDHELQPKFEVLTPPEKEECMKSYNLKSQQFPKMKSSDPVAKYLALKKGDVMRVLIPSELSGQKVEYCIVI